MKKLFCLILILTLALSASISDPTPKEGDTVNFEGDLTGTHLINATFEWDFDSNIYTPFCYVDGPINKCNINMTIPSNSIGESHVYHFTNSATGSTDIDSFVTEDIVIDLTVPSSADVEDVIDYEISVLWEDGSVPPAQTIVVNVRPIINENFPRSVSVS